MKRSGILVLLTYLSTLLAGEYGRIAGSISNHVEGGDIRPLDSAQITLVGSNITVESNEFGEFFIPFIRAGGYRMKVQWRGMYCMIDSINITADAATLIDLYSSWNPVRDPEFIVAIRRQQLKASKAHDDAIVTSRDIRITPATTPYELIRLQPGIVTSDYGLHLRGSTSDDMTYYVDGLVFMWPYSSGWQPVPLHVSAIEELSLRSSGIGAEYGETRAGIVNIVTRQAGTRHAGKIQYFTDEIIPGDKFNFGYNKYDISFSGPISAGLSYFLSGDLLFTDAFQQAKHKIPSPRNDYHGYGKLTYQLPNTRGQLSFSGFRAREQWVRWSPYIEPGNDLKYFDQRPMTRTKYWYGMAVLDYRFSAKNLTSLRIGIDHFDRCYGNRDYAWEDENGHSWYDDYRFKAEHLIPYLLDEQWQEQNSVSIRNILVDSMMAYHSEAQRQGTLTIRNNPWGIEGLFYTYGDYPVWSYSQHDNIQARLDLNQYFNRNYTLKSGIHFIKYSSEYYSNPLAWHNAPLWDYYTWEPYRIDSYLQNNMTYKSISANIGLRLDYFNPNTEPLIDTTPLMPDTTGSEPSLRISPRLGIYLRVLDGLNLGVDYEHYLRVYYRYQPLSPMTFRTTAYGISVQYHPVYDACIGCHLYYRRHNDWMQAQNDQYEYNLYGDFAYEDYIGVMGMQIDLRSQPMNYLTLNVAYNFQYAYGSNTYWWQYYQPPYFPKIVPADFDEPYQVRMAVHLDLPPHRAFKLFKSLKSSLSFTLFSGQPYTPIDLRGNQIDNKNAGRIPGYWNVDWKIARSFRIRRANIIFSVLVLNLFNTRQVIDIYNTTGNPDDHGDPLPSVDQFMNTAISNSRYSPQADLDHDGLITPVEAREAYINALHDLYSDPTNYGNPLRIRLGIGIEF